MGAGTWPSVSPTQLALLAAHRSRSAWPAPPPGFWHPACHHRRPELRASRLAALSASVTSNLSIFMAFHTSAPFSESEGAHAWREALLGSLALMRRTVPFELASMPLPREQPSLGERLAVVYPSAWIALVRRSVACAGEDPITFNAAQRALGIGAHPPDESEVRASTPSALTEA